MTNLAVSHLAGRETNIPAARVHKRAGEIAQQRVVIRLSRERYRVGISLGTVSPTIEDDENEWSILHYSDRHCPTGESGEGIDEDLS